ncbi:MAG: branched-chain amino acid aminotransferase [Thermoflexales bacterium]|nr:branched-chain amino acid aminotransferase [Thermoflexales bacterium]MCS7324715.1 branched-chain amino acid aminotransferase [Thermoflexales bacterium]MCX7939144.1 branched-chain amino acid aminotransferase [Thermoflexales bacterium]MDW8054072.1 branched-chain amino acid aminotransferase [Anaerolineae bacterium]MDW8292593.1 branched-chain amino acid aminotransferase [Anaerolineae bacterium]
MQITIEPLGPDARKPLAEPFTFGKTFTNRMFSQKYSPELGWHDARIGPYRPLVLDPATVVLHYAQEVFEGTKAYRRPDGHINLFRPWENVARMNRSARRMAMAELDPESHLEAIVTLVRLEHEWVPRGEFESLYIRPTLIATDIGLGVYASKTYLHYIILSPAGPYFGSGFKPVSVYVSTDYVRAVRGGTGAAKTGGNYAASLLESERVKPLGYQQVLWLDAVERRYVEEVGAMNIAFVYNGRRIVTPALSGSILEGVTRDSVLKLAPTLGYEAEETRLDIHDVLRDIERGEITEVFGMGTAAVIAPVDRLGYQGKDYFVREAPGPVAQHLFKTLTDIQYGRAPDPFNWTLKIEVPQ